MGAGAGAGQKRTGSATLVAAPTNRYLQITEGRVALPLSFSVDPDLTSHFFSLLVLYHIFPNFRLDPGSGS